MESSNPREGGFRGARTEKRTMEPVVGAPIPVVGASVPIDGASVPIDGAHRGM